MYLCVWAMRKSLCVRVWAWSPLERYGFQKDLAYKFTSMRIYDIIQHSILSLISQTLLGKYFRMHNYYQIFSIPLPIVSPFVPGHTYSKMDGRVETLRRRQHSNEGPVSIPLPKIRYVTVQPTNNVPSFSTTSIFLQQKNTSAFFLSPCASLESSQYLVLSMTATVVFLVLKDWSEEVVLFLSRAVKILNQKNLQILEICGDHMMKHGDPGSKIWNVIDSAVLMQSSSISSPPTRDCLAVKGLWLTPQWGCS